MLGVKRIERVLPTGTSLTVVGEVCHYHFHMCKSYNQELAEADNFIFGSTMLIHIILMLQLRIIFISPRLTTFTCAPSFSMKSLVYHVEN